MNVRKLGTSMVAIGAVATVVGLAGTGIELADDPGLVRTRGALALESFWVALFLGGLAVVVLGAALLLGGGIYGRRDGRVVAGRRLAQFAIPAVVVGLVAAGAAAINNSPLGEPSTAPGTALVAQQDATLTGTGDDAGAGGHDHGDMPADHASEDMPHDHGDEAAAGEDHGHGQIIPGTATGDSPCEIAAPTPASPGQTGTGEGGSEADGEHGERGLVVQQPLTAAERRNLEVQMRAARTVVDRYPTVAAAEAGGYGKSTPYVPCIGAHYTNVSKVVGFDPAEPSELLYDGTGPDARIVGLSYLVFSPSGAPEGFAGENDHWHQHNANGGLCFAPGGLVIGGEDTSLEDCKARGGEKRELRGIWMVHAWVVPGFECSWGVFAGECPELGGRVGGTAWDA
jgi:hypothetical protein